MTVVAAPMRLRPGVWTVLDQRTGATFSVGNLGVRVVHGSIAVSSGVVEVGENGLPVNGRIELDLRTIDTGITKRDTDLRKPSLLDIDTHPTMTFTTRDIVTDPAGWTARGELRLRGTSCRLVLTGPPPELVDGMLSVVGSATLDRYDIGIRAPRAMIGREVTISVETWLRPAGDR
ncbi:MAG: YceI family protein [Actinobacteria bacterium]|nr:YceI family protein [Actinomycetota bacterium]MBW3647779.1 YceI family protein [Actinomycetota bacterium]